MLEPLPCKDGSDWTPDLSTEFFLVDQYLNLGQEWRKMKIWLEMNEARRKTRRGMKRFVASWMLRSGILRPPRPKQLAQVVRIDREAAQEHLGRLREQIRR